MTALRLCLFSSLVFFILMLSAKESETATSTIESKNFPNNYPDNLVATYEFTVREHYHVSLDFTSFDLEAHPDCSNDYVEIRNGLSDTSALIGRYCNISLPFAVRSSGNQMRIKFVTNRSINKSGFRATITAACTELWSSPTGTIQSPNFPSSYPNNLNCSYIILAPEGYRITLDFTTFDLEVSTACVDYVLLSYGSRNTSGTTLSFSDRFCGAVLPLTFRSTGNLMTISFVTDFSISRMGFNATFITDSAQSITTNTTGETGIAATTIATATPITTSTATTGSMTATTITTATAISTITTSTATVSRTDATTITTARPSTTNTDSTAVTTSKTNASNPTSTTTATASTVHVVTTSEELPFDTDGSQNLTLTCDVDKASLVTEYGWSVTCRRQTGNKCVFLPQPEDDGKLVTCTVTLVDGGSATGSLKLSLNYPPQTPPVITGYKKGEVLKAGGDFRVTCSVNGGKPLVHNVIFTCDGHPDTAPDITGQTEVQSAVQFKPVTTEDDGKRCTCTAEWKNTDWYRLSATTILRVNATMKGAIEDQGEPSIPAIAGGVGTVVVILIVIVVAVIRRRNGQHDYDRPGKTGNSSQDPASPHPGLAPLDGQPFVVSSRSFDPIATPDMVDGTANNNRSSQYAEIGEVSDAPPVPSRRPLSTGSTYSYIQPITEPEHDYIECIGP